MSILCSYRNNLCEGSTHGGLSNRRGCCYLISCPPYLHCPETLSLPSPVIHHHTYDTVLPSLLGIVIFNRNSLSHLNHPESQFPICEMGIK